jgi:hypothetical protein
MGSGGPITFIHGPARAVSMPNTTGYQPVPPGNLPGGMEVGLHCSAKATFAKDALTLPPGW